MRTILLSVAISTLFLGCVARLDKKPGSVEKLNHGPINAAEQYGVVSYDITEGEDGARQDAYDEMYKACNGKYKIIDEEIKKGDSTFGVALSKDAFIADGETRVYIKFLCVK